MANVISSQPLAAQIALWNSRVSTCGANLGDLQSVREFARLKTKSMQGLLGATTAHVATQMLADMSALWRLWQSMNKVVETINAGRPGFFGYSAEVERLLRQAVVHADTMTVSATARGAFQAGEQTEMLTLDQAAERIEALTGRIQDTLSRAREGWALQSSRSSVLTCMATELLEQATNLGEGTSLAAAESLVAEVQAVTLSCENDPVGSLDAITKAEQRVAEVRGLVEASQQAILDAQKAMRRSQARLASLQSAHIAAEVLMDRAASRIDPASGLHPLFDVRELENLQRWMGRLASLPEGRAHDIAAGLAAWESAASNWENRERQVVEAASALLRTRKDLREQFEMLDATATDLFPDGRLPQAVAVSRDAALQNLRQNLMRIDAATLAVARFESDLLTISGMPARGIS